MVAIPPAKDTDAEDVVWGLQTAEALWKRGERIDAIVWLRRAAQAAGEALDDDRALELARSAAELSDYMATQPNPAVTVPPGGVSLPPAGVATTAPPAHYDPHNASTFVPFGDDDARVPQAAAPFAPTHGQNGPPTSIPESGLSIDVDLESRPAPPVGRPPSSPTIQTAEPYFPPAAPRRVEGDRVPSSPPAVAPAARQQQPAPEDRDEHEPRTTTSVPPAERVHAGMFNPWDDGAASSPQPIAPPPPPAPRFEEEEEVITSVRPQQLAQQRADALAGVFTSTTISGAPRPRSDRPAPAAAPSVPRPAPGRPPPLPPRARKQPLAPAAPVAPAAPAAPAPRMTPPPPSPTQVMAQPPRAAEPADDLVTSAPQTSAPQTSEPEAGRTEIAQAQDDAEHQRALALALGEVPSAIPAPPATEPKPPPVEPSQPELPSEAVEPSVSATPEKLDLDSVEAFADLPDDARSAFAAAAKVSALGEGEEVSSFALAYILSGTVDVAATMVDAPAARLTSGAVLRSRGTTDEGVPMRLIGVDAGVVATWSDAEVEDAFRTCPWVEEDLRVAADRLQTLVGVTIGPLGERLDASIREQIIARLTMRTLSAGEVVVTAGEQMPGLFLIGVGELELVDGENVAGVVGSGEFLFAGEVLGGGDAPRTARAGAGGALILFGDRLVAQELLVTCPPLLEVFAGM